MGNRLSEATPTITQEEMALFGGLELDTSSIPERHNPANGLTKWQRFLVTNLYDTQIERRRKYLKQLGYELDDGDGDSYRLLGHNTKFQPIEPVFDLRSSADFATEAFMDVGDVTFDSLAGVFQASAALMGGAAGLLGGPVPAFAAAVGAGTVANAFSEGVKADIGDFFLEDDGKDAPLDMKDVAFQSVLVGLMGAAGKPLSKFWTGAKVTGKKAVRSVLKQMMIRKSKNTMNARMAEKVAANPEMFLPESTTNSVKKLLGIQEEIFGTTMEHPHSTRQLTGGVAADAIEPLNKRADLEIEKLALMPEANFEFEDLRKAVTLKFSNILKKEVLEEEDEQALKYLNKEFSDLKKQFTVVPPTSKILDAKGNVPKPPEPFMKPISFKAGREFLKRIQNATYQEASSVKNNGVLKRAASGLKELADRKAAELGSDLPAINAKRSKILSIYPEMQRLLTDGHLENSHLGKSKTSKEKVNNILTVADELLGTDLADRIETLQFKAAMENIYDTPGNFGTGNAVRDFVVGGIKEAPKKAFAGGVMASVVPGIGPQAGASMGAAHGFLQGGADALILSQPENMMKKFIKINNHISDLEQGIVRTRPNSIAGGLGQVSQQVFDGVQAPTPEEEEAGQSLIDRGTNTDPSTTITEEELKLFENLGN